MVDIYRPGILGTTGSFGSIQWTNGVSGSTQYEIMDVSRNLANLGTVSGSGASTAGSYSTDNTVTGGSLTDGTATMSAGAISGVTTMSGSGTSHAGSYTTIGAVTGGSLTDGTATISSGAASGLTTVGSSGAATLDTGANGSSFGGDLSFVTGSATGDFTISGNLYVNGTTTQVDTDNLNVKDKNILINDGGAAASAGGAGIDVEEDGIVSGYMKVSSDRGAWEMKAPDNAGVLTMDIDATKTITVAGALNIEADSIINQDLTTDASVTFAGLDNSSGNITNAGSIAGAASIDGTGDLTMGSITMTGFSVDTAGALTGSSLTSTTTLDAAGLSSLDGGIDVNSSNFTVSTAGAVVAASLNNSSGGITNAGSIAGAASIDGTGDLTMGSITMTGFSVDADGDTSAKSLTSTSTLDVSGLASLDGGIDVNGSNFTVSTAGAVTMMGSLDVDSTANIQGALTLQNNFLFSGESTYVDTILDEDDMASNDENGLATQQSIKAYVDSQVGDSSLSGSGDSGTFVIDLDSQVLSVIGTANEVDTVASGQQLQIGLPSDVTIGNDLTVTTDLVVGGDSTLGDLSSDSLTVNASLASSLIWDTDSTYNIGSSTAKLAAVYANNVYTGDFHMKNERGDWTLFEESDHIRIRNNTTGQEFKLDMSPIK